MGKIWNLEQFANKIAIIDEYRNSLSYGHLNRETKELADKLHYKELTKYFE